MRIGIVTTHLPPIMGGIEVHCENLAVTLAESGHDVVLYGSLEPSQDSSMAVEHRGRDLEIRRVPAAATAWLRRPSRFRNLSRILRADHEVRPFDLLHAHQLYPVGVAASVLSQRLGTRLVVTEHGSILDDRRMWWKRMLIRRASKHSTAIITASRELAGVVAKVGVPAKLIHSMPNAIAPERLEVPDDDGSVRRRFGAHPKDFVAMTVRRLYPKNGVQYAVRAVPQCLENIPDFRLVVIGDGPLRPELERLVKALDIEDNVRFLGIRPNSEIPSLMRAADIGVFPSLAEATSIAALEFMAVGTPVVASRVGGLPEIIRDGETGFLFDIGFTASRYDDPGLPSWATANLADAIARSARSNLPAMGEEAKTIVRERFSWDAYARQLDEGIYREAS
jgi:glycosyltransferase involved in cell wall biosynthesis